MSDITIGGAPGQAPGGPDSNENNSPFVIVVGTINRAALNRYLYAFLPINLSYYVGAQIAFAWEVTEQTGAMVPVSSEPASLVIVDDTGATIETQPTLFDPATDANLSQIIGGIVTITEDMAGVYQARLSATFDQGGGLPTQTLVMKQAFRVCAG